MSETVVAGVLVVGKSYDIVFTSYRCYYVVILDGRRIGITRNEQ